MYFPALSYRPGEQHPNKFLVKAPYLSLDPDSRSYINEGRSYINAVGIRKTMRALGLIGLAGALVLNVLQRHHGCYSMDRITESFRLRSLALECR